MLKNSNKRYSLESLIYMLAFLYVLMFSFRDSITVDIYPAETILNEILDKAKDTTSSPLWLGIIKTSIRIFSVFSFMYLIKKNQSRFNFKLSHSIIFFVFFFLCFYTLFIFLMINGYILYFYSLHQDLIHIQYINTFTFWQKAFLHLLTYKNILYLVIVNNLFSIVVFYTVFLKFLDDKSFKIITIKVMHQVNELIPNKLSLKQDPEMNESKHSYDNSTSKSDNLYESTKNKVSILTLKKLGEEHLISVKDIIVIQSDGNYLDIVTDNSNYAHRASLSGILADIPDYFIRIHRSTIINLNKVKGVKTDYASKNIRHQVILKNNQLYVISKKYKNIFNVRWRSYICFKESQNFGVI